MIQFKELMSKDEKAAWQKQQREINLQKMKEQNLLPSVPGSTQPPPVAPAPLPRATIAPAELSIEDLQNELFKRKQDLENKVKNMKLDADTYRVNIPTIRVLTEDKTQAERIKLIGTIAVITHVPIIIVAHYIGEMYGVTEELKSLLNTLMKFYTIDEVLNVKSSL